MGDIMDGNDNRRNSVASVTTNPPIQSSTGVKEIQVTAKEIVDRISNFQHMPPVGLESIGVFDEKQAKPTGYVKPFTGGSEPSGSSSGDEKTDDTRSDKDAQPTTTPPPSTAGGTSQTEKPRRLSSKNSRLSVGSFTSEGGGSSTIEQRAIEHLLDVVQKIAQEAKPEDEIGIGDMSAISNMHWVYSVESYLRSLEIDWKNQKALTHKFATQLLGWIKQLFHFGPETNPEKEFNSIHPHWESNSGLTTIAKLSLHTKFPEIWAQGYQYFHESNKQPVIYCADDLVGQQICCSLGLPLTYTSIVNFTEPNWVEQFESKLKADIDKGKVPVAIFLNAAVENLEKGVKLAETFKVWTHFYGNNVTAYFLKRPETKQIGNSFTIDLTKWLKNPKLPYLTIYKAADRVDSNLMDILGLGSPKLEILCFTPWLIVHVFGKSRLSALINEAIHRGKFLLDMVRRHECLHVVPNWSKATDGNIILSTLTFQYNPPNYKRRNLTIDSPSSPNKVTDSYEPSAQYVDTLNSWLFHIMERDLKGLLSIEFVFVESRGWNIHVDVVKSQKLLPNEEAAIISVFDSHMKVLHATVKQRLRFLELVKVSEELEWVNDHGAHWAGLGAVRYIPKFFRKGKTSAPTSVNGVDGSASDAVVNGATNSVDEPPDHHTAEARANIDHLNAKIIDKLKAIDSAFSLGEAANGVWCVQFGMVTEDTDVKELVRLVIATGLEIEESSEFLDRMSELVRKGIEKATEELKKEAEEAMWEEGILRRVPVVGTFVSWFSPPTKESGVRGRALNLTQGKVESTENIYKYHMQIDASSIPNNMTKPIRE
ncbi:Pyridoxal-dependent decarboxylase domain-containing protein 1 [Orchesella cincta]|uniref:Pyridoxal-dependent decarboxylase domain-containing protein 1 n=1 Tax=Orchesella cincta TaxID=48709 RepID=A0A1D2NLF9_ORCCI|nr:Pyridoxal-dependent decarboxylase domain-containing protein 1 [Orchesella cincta]